VKRLVKYGCFLLLIIFLLLPAGKVHAETATSDLTMVVSSSCYYYTKQSATTAARADYLSFGEEVEVKELGTKWSEIKVDGTPYYILSKNIDYLSDTVIKNRVMVSPGAYACSSSSTLGYVFYGTEVDVLGEATSKSGVTYVHCLISAVYESDGSIVKAENVEGYINASYLNETATPKVVNYGTYLYDADKSKQDRITAGEEVSVLMENATWSKVRYDGSEYYMYTKYLDDKVLYITANRVIQTVDAKPGSGTLHYVYWNTPITVINTYESDTYGTYYYCKISGDYGFIREYSTSGIQYAGYNMSMTITGNTSMYEKADSSSEILQTLNLDDVVTVEYISESWVRVNYDGQTGYVSSGKLEYVTRTADGSYYTTGYRLYQAVKKGADTATGVMDSETVSLIAQNDKYGFSYIQTSSGDCYWIASSSLTESEETGVYYVSSPGATLHVSSESSSDTISVPYMTELTVVGEIVDRGWTKVLYDGETYYLWQDSGVSVLTDTKSSYSYTGNSSYQQAVIDMALDILNNWSTVYAHGQSDGVANDDGTYGFDCSGFASYVLDSVMSQTVPTYNVSADLETLYNTSGIYNEGYSGEFSASEVNLDDLQPGDVLFFNLSEESEDETETSEYNHCGIYLGNGEFIHCSHSWGGGVRIMPLSEMYEEGLVAIRRYLPDSVTAADITLYSTSQKTYVYETNDSGESPVATLGAGEAVTLKFTDNGNWAYVEYDSDKYGFILIKYLTEENEELNETRYVAKTSCKLYESYSTSASYAEVFVGTEVTYVGRYSDSSYYKVIYEDSIYYIYSPDGIDNVLVSDYDTLMAGTGVAEIGNCNYTYLRSAMSSNADNVVSKLYAGEEVTVIVVSDSGTWTYVKISDGTYGFVLSKYLVQ